MQRWRLVKRPMITDEKVVRLRKGGGEIGQPPWEGRTVQGRQFEQETLAGGRFDGPVELKRRARRPHRRKRLYPAGRKPSPADRQQAHPTVILGKHVDQGPGGAGRTRLVEDRGESGLEWGHGFGAFLACDGRGRLG